MPVPHAALGDNVLGKMLHVTHVAFQHGDFQTVVVINVHMQRGNREIKDRSLSAQYEHTIVVTDNGCEILTLRKDDTIPAIISHDE